MNNIELDHKLVCKLFEFTKSTFYNWKKEERPIIALLEKYFTKEDLTEFLETKRIKRFEINKGIHSEIYDINNKFFFEHYSRKIQNIDFYKFIFPEFKKYINDEDKRYKGIRAEYEYTVSSGSIRLVLIQFIIALQDNLIKEYLIQLNEKYNININNIEDNTNFKARTIEIISNLSNLELFLLFHSYEDFILKHRLSFGE